MLRTVIQFYLTGRFSRSFQIDICRVTLQHELSTRKISLSGDMSDQKFTCKSERIVFETFVHNILESSMKHSHFHLKKKE